MAELKQSGSMMGAPAYPDEIIKAVGKGKAARDYALAIANDPKFLGAIEDGIESIAKNERMKIVGLGWEQEIRFAMLNLLVPMRGELTFGE